MIYTVTFNPSLDYIVTMNGFEIGKTNRTTKEQLLAGGKGINVSTVLTNLRIENIALGFIAGFTGQELKRMTEVQGLVTDFIELAQGVTRINVKLKDYDGTEINGMGPVIDDEAVEQLTCQLRKLQEDDVVVLAGSIPSSVSSTIYRELMEELAPRGVRFVVDATRDLIMNVLEFHPFLIKPNNHELGELFGTELLSRESVVPYAKKLQEKGARNVLVSMSGEGAVLVAENGEIFMSPAPKGELINAVGAGDSMVAGFLAGWAEKRDYEHAFKMGLAAGSASAFSELLAAREKIEEVYKNLW